ncbi:MAG TPA: 50S ribosomal protein L25/general stress protein Ctc [Gemmatimonadaceae bacterium]|nr:50S ribosomal protein L25/general stress protein Ctc [Gemmatimonadaceae bacterium]
MATATLNATPRSDVGKGAARKLRASLRIPGVVYGHHREATPLAIDARELEKLLGSIAAGTTVVELNLGGRTSKTLIREIQRHPYKRQVLHIDFQELVAGEKITVNVPIHLVGTAAGVKDGGIVEEVMREVSVEVDPANIPSHFEIDISHLGINDSVHVSDIKVPEGVELLEDVEATVAVVAPPRAVEEAPAPAEGVVEAAPEPELIRKPKDEEEGAEGE